jgi:hypothetical protein
VVATAQPGLAGGDCGSIAAVVRLGVLESCLRDGVCPASCLAAPAWASPPGLAGKPPLGLGLGLGKPDGLGLGTPDGLGFGVGMPDGVGFGVTIGHG